MNLILDLLFPKRCVGCGKFDTYLCPSCISNIKQTDLVCPRCDRPAVGGQTHPVCRRKFGLDGLWSLSVYQDPIRKIIKKVKYGLVKEATVPLVDLLVEYWARYQPFLLDEIKKTQGKDWIVVPVPLYWFRENSRGFNQSALIGRQFAEKLGLAYGEVLKRSRHTRFQARLKGRERRQNIKNAFEINTASLRAQRGNLDLQSRFLRPFGSQNDKVLLIDDVWTTGSTLRECCYILKRNGAKKVWALTLAK